MARGGFTGLAFVGRRTTAAQGGDGPEFDTSEYRQATYGAPTHYCDPTKTTNGAGTSGDPWQPSQAMANAVAGNVVGWLNGQMSASFPHSTDTQTPTLNPANSGTSGNRIVHVARYGAVALNNPPTNALRTQLRHDAVGVVASGGSETGNGASMYGSEFRNYITWDGFYVDIDEAEIASDTGCLSIRECTGVHVRNFYVKSKELTAHSNCVVYRPNNCVGTILHNGIIENHTNVPPGTQAGLASDQYADQDYLIEYITVRNCDRGFYTKGAPGGVFNYGTMRYLKIHGVDLGLANNAWDTNPSNLQIFHHILVFDYSSIGFYIGTNHPTAENVLAHHLTIANGTATGGGALGPIYIADATTAFANYTIRDSIFDWANASAGRAVEGGEYGGSTFPTMNYNRYYRVGAGVTWTMGAATQTTIAQWRSVLGGGSQELNSDTLGADPFNNRATDDYTIAAASSALLTADSSGGQLGAYEGGAYIGSYGSYGF